MKLEVLTKADHAETRALPVQTGLCGDVCNDCPVRDKSVCGGLSFDALAQLHLIGRQRVLRKGQTLIWEGDEAPVVANILSGMVKLSSATSNGNEQILGIVGTSGFVGRPNGGISAHSIEALVDTRLCVFPGPAFRSFIETHPEMGMALLDRAFAELDRARRWQMMLARASASERMAGLLLEFASKLPVEGQRYTFPLSRGQMADLAGLTIETVSRQLTRLKTAGVLSLPSRNEFIIHDRGALAAMAGDIPHSGLH